MKIITITSEGAGVRYMRHWGRWYVLNNDGMVIRPLKQLLEEES